MSLLVFSFFFLNRRDERRTYKDEFENWQGQFKPRGGSTKRTVEGVSSEEDNDSKPTSSSNPDLGKFVYSFLERSSLNNQKSYQRRF